jgi:putative DNA primase/helicase
MNTAQMNGAEISAIFAALAARGLGTAAIAEAIGKAAPTISDWQQGRRSPSVEDMAALRTLLAEGEPGPAGAKPAKPSNGAPPRQDPPREESADWRGADTSTTEDEPAAPGSADGKDQAEGASANQGTTEAGEADKDDPGSPFGLEIDLSDPAGVAAKITREEHLYDEVLIQTLAEHADGVKAGEVERVKAAIRTHTKALKIGIAGFKHVLAQRIAAVRADRAARARAAEDDWQQGDKGLWKGIETNEGTSWKKVTHSPFTAPARTRDAHGGTGIVVCFTDDAGREHEISIPRGMVVTDQAAVIGRLVGGGLRLAGSLRFAQAALADFLVGTRPSEERVALSRVGWTADGAAFVLPSRVLGGCGQIVADIRLSPRGLESKGTLLEWREAARPLLRGNALAALATGTALAAPLLSKIGTPGGGFHLTGRQKIAKSLLAALGASVWGVPDPQAPNTFVESWRATANGAELVFAARNDLVTVLDELGEASPRDIEAVCYMLSHGQPKVRMSKLGDARKAQGWRTLALSTGERTLAEHAASARLTLPGGVFERVADIPAEIIRGSALESVPADRIEAFAVGRYHALSGAYGTAGPAFVESLLEEPCGDLRERLAAWLAAREVGDKRTVPTRFALAAVALGLAAERGIVPLGRGEAEELVARAYDHWRGSKEEVTPGREAADILAELLAWVATKGDRIISYRVQAGDRPECGAAKVADPAGWRRLRSPEPEQRQSAPTAEHLILTRQQWDRLAAEIGVAGTVLARALTAAQALDREKGRMTRSTRLPSGHRIKAYVVDLRAVRAAADGVDDPDEAAADGGDELDDFP